MFDKATLDSIEAGAGITTPGAPGETIGMVLPYVFGAAGIILLLNIISAGLKMMTSSGDPKAIGAAQAKLTTSAVGILILFTSFWIVKLVLQFLGIELLLFDAI